MITRSFLSKTPVLYDNFFIPKSLSLHALTKKSFQSIAVTSDSINVFMKEKIQKDQKKMFESDISFEEFKNKNIESFEDYKKSVELVGIDTTNVEKIKEKYETYCFSLFQSYQIDLRGENPARMI